MSVGIPVALILAATLLAGAYLVLWLDRFRAEPALLYAVTVLWGGAAGTVWVTRVAPRFFNAMGAVPWVPTRDVRAALVVVAALWAVLALAVVVALRRIWFGAIVDGAAFGTAVGTGFGAAISLTLAFGGRAVVWVVQPLAVGAWCGAWLGASLGALRLEARWSRRLPVLMLSLVGFAGPGLALFGVYPPDAIAAAGPSARIAPWLVPVWLACLIGVFAVGFAIERRVVSSQLADEAEVGVLPAIRVADAARWTRRSRRAWWPDRDERRAVNRLLLTLAFRRARIARLAPEKADIYSLELGRLRDRVRRVMSPADDERP